MSSVDELHADSGLTWDQLSKLFGVSRNALFNWSAGGRMTLAHQAILDELADIVARLPADNSTDRRKLLLTPDGEGYSIYDRYLMRRRNGSNERVA